MNGGGGRSVRRAGKRIDGFEQRYREQQRAMITAARRNGVTHETIDGRRFRVVHLPAQHPRAL